MHILPAARHARWVLLGRGETGMRLRCWVGVAVAAVLGGCEAQDPGTGRLLAARSALEGARYTLLEIPALPGDQFANAWDINERGQVVGASFNTSGNGSAVPFVYEPGIGSRRLIDVEGEADGINDRGAVAAS